MYVPIVGERVYSTLGHLYEIVAVLSAYRYRVQPLTPCGTAYVPVGGQVVVGRSELRLGD